MASEPRSFLWVNKDKQSLSLSSSEGSETSQILSHVQRVCVNERKYRPTRNLATKDRNSKAKIQIKIPKLENRELTDSKINEFVQNFDLAILKPAGADPFSATTLTVDVHSRELLTYHIAWWRAVSPDWT